MASPDHLEALPDLPRALIHAAFEDEKSLVRLASLRLLRRFQWSGDAETEVSNRFREVPADLLAQVEQSDFLPPPDSANELAGLLASSDEEDRLLAGRALQHARKSLANLSQQQDTRPVSSATLELADRILPRLFPTRDLPSPRIVRPLAPRELSDLITAGLALLALDSFHWLHGRDEDWGPDLVQPLGRLRFRPDLGLLFQIFSALSRRALSFWISWLSDHPLEAGSWFPYGSGGDQFAVSLRIAWTASVATPIDWLRFLDSALGSLRGKTRFVAAQFIELAMRYRGSPPPGVFAGGTMPEDVLKRRQREQERERAITLDTDFGIDFGQEYRGIAAPGRPRDSSGLPASSSDGGATRLSSPKSSPSRLPVPAQATQGSRPEPSSEERPARYADFAFFRQTASGQQGGPIAPQAPLMVNAKYQIEVSIRSKAIGIQSSAERVAISEPGQNFPVEILVIADSGDFEIPEPVQKLLLPPNGDSVENARFRDVRPQRRTNSEGELAQIRVRLYYNLNLLEVVVISAEVVSPLEDATRSQLGLERPISLVQQLREREYRNFDLIMPRSMHIFVERGKGSFQLTFTLEKEGGPEITLTGSSRIPEASLEDSLVSIRKTLLGISIWKVFGSAVDCPDQDLFSKGMRDLARQGRELWTKIFELERGSSLYVIGEWLRAHPLPAGSRIQVSVDPSATAFILPWNLLYDGAVPAQSDAPIASDGFWGLRYQIEQRSRFAYDHCDEPVATSGPLDIGFLRSPIAEAALHLQALQGLVEMSQGRIATVNPIESATEAYRYLEECPSHIVSFFAHGHTKFAESARTGFTEEDFVALYEDTSDPSLREAWKELYDEIKARQYQSDSSWIKLRYGKLYLLELYEKIQELRTGPVVLLNMCESAQLTPSLQESFIHFFLDRGARAVLGTECSMRPLFAHQFAQKILESLVFGDTIGEALLNARKEFASRGNPLGLAYTLFGSLTIRFNPPPLERA